MEDTSHTVRVHLIDRTNAARAATLIVRGMDDADVARAARALVGPLGMSIASGIVHDVRADQQDA